MARVIFVGDLYQADAVPQPPLGIWGGGNVPMPSPPIANVPGAPGYQPPLGIWGPNPGFPTNPIAGIPGLPGYEPPRPPLGIWGPPGPWVSPPIANVPGAPGYVPPLQIWGPGDPRPNPPIYLPPESGVTPPPRPTNPMLPEMSATYILYYAPSTGQWYALQLPAASAPPTEPPQAPQNAQMQAPRRG